MEQVKIDILAPIAASKPPGLVKRFVVRSFKDYVVLHEEWDLTVPGCPMIAIRRDNFEIDCEVKGIFRTVRMSQEEYAALLPGALRE